MMATLIHLLHHNGSANLFIRLKPLWIASNLKSHFSDYAPIKKVLVANRGNSNLLLTCLKMIICNKL